MQRDMLVQMEPGQQLLGLSQGPSECKLKQLCCSDFTAEVDGIKKRRRRCGECGPCLLRQNCGVCKQCINRKVGKQICHFRKCESLRKKTPPVLAGKVVASSSCRKNLWKERKKGKEGARLSNFQNNQRTKAEKLYQENFENLAQASHSYVLAPSDHIQNFARPSCLNKLSVCHSHASINAEQEVEVGETPLHIASHASNVPSKAPDVLKIYVGEQRCEEIVSENEEFMFQLQSPSCLCDAPSDACYYYSHLGYGQSLESLRCTLEKRFQVSGNALSIRLLKPTKEEGKNAAGCPLARWVVRRKSDDEKFLVFARKRAGHICDQSFVVTLIVVWEAITKQYAGAMYKYLVSALNEYAFTTQRRCCTNESKTCMCQGGDAGSQGASFSFGCSWSMFFNGCKFSKSAEARKFRMQDPQKEKDMQQVLDLLADHVSSILKRCAPQTFANMTRHEKEGSACRIGNNPGKPFSGVTACVDFCAHSHKDMHDMTNGTTVVCTLLKPDCNARDDEQFHVLTFYQLLDNEGKVETPNYIIPPHLLSSKLKVHERTHDNGLPLSPVGCSKSADGTARVKEESKLPANAALLSQSVTLSRVNVSCSAARTDTEDLVESVPGSVDVVPNDVPFQSLVKKESPESSPVQPEKCRFSLQNIPQQNISNVGLEALLLSERDLPSATVKGDSLGFPPNSGCLPKFVDERFVPSLLNYTLYEFQRRSGGKSCESVAEKRPCLHFVDDMQIPVFRQHWNAFQHQELKRMFAGDKFKTICKHSKKSSGEENSSYGNGGLLFGSEKISNSNFESAGKNCEGYDRLVNTLNMSQAGVAKDMGGVAIALDHGSFLIECARHEVHATTALRNPQRKSPTRISMVFYQHKALDRLNHGYDFWQERMKKRQDKQTLREDISDLKHPSDEVPRFSDFLIPADAAGSLQSLQDKLSFDEALVRLESATDEGINDPEHVRPRDSISAPNFPLP